MQTTNVLSVWPGLLGYIFVLCTRLPCIRTTPERAEFTFLLYVIILIIYLLIKVTRRSVLILGISIFVPPGVTITQALVPFGQPLLDCLGRGTRRAVNLGDNTPERAVMLIEALSLIITQP